MCFTSFVMCLSYRYIPKESILKGFSHCDKCKHRLYWYDLIPAVSYILLNGKCRYCHKNIDKKYPLMEMSVSLLCVFLFYTYGININNIIICFVLFTFLYVSLVDIQIYEIPDEGIIMMIILWLIYAYLNRSYINGIKGSFFISFVVYILYVIMKVCTHKKTMGMGDLKLLFVTGLYMGVYRSVVCLCLSSIMGLVYMILTRKTVIPFGPFMFISFYIVYLTLGYVNIM